MEYIPIILAKFICGIFDIIIYSFIARTVLEPFMSEDSVLICSLRFFTDPLLIICSFILSLFCIKDELIPVFSVFLAVAAAFFVQLPLEGLIS